MQLTRFSDYSLQVLMHLGLHQGKWVRIRQISESHDISRNHLMKIVSYLGQRGFLESQRGPGGGVRLKRAPAEINLAEVLRATEHDLNMAQCFSDPSACRLTPDCRLRGILVQALEAFLGVLADHSLADLIEPRRKLQRLLLRPAARAS